jgi:hypothetical protein
MIAGLAERGPDDVAAVLDALEPHQADRARALLADYLRPTRPGSGSALGQARAAPAAAARPVLTPELDLDGVSSWLAARISRSLILDDQDARPSAGADGEMTLRARQALAKAARRVLPQQQPPIDVAIVPPAPWPRRLLGAVLGARS